MSENKLTSISPLIIQEIYKKVGNISKLAAHFAVSTYALRNYLADNNIDFGANTPFKIKILPKEDVENAILSSKSPYETAKKLYCSIAVLKRSVIAHKLSLPKTDRRQNSCNDYFFSKDNITEKSMYWAGFLAADGCLLNNKNGKKVALGLAEADSTHVISFAHDLNFDGKIGHGAKKNHFIYRGKNYSKILYSCRVAVRSDRLFDDLLEFGLTPCKTNTYTVPQWLIEHPLFHHFIRGYWDGDGCFSIAKHKGKARAIHANLVGNCPAVIQIFEFLKLHLLLRHGCISGSKSHSKKLKMADFMSVRDVPKIVTYLYKDATIFLERKKTKADMVFEFSENSKFCDFDAEILSTLYAEHQNLNAVGEILGFTGGAIARQMKKLGLSYISGCGNVRPRKKKVIEP